MTFVTQEFFPKIGGAATVVGEMACALERLGKSVRVLAPGEAQESDSRFRFKVERSGTRGKQDWLDRIALLRTLKRRAAEGEEWVFSDPGAVRAALYARWFGIRFRNPPVIILHGTDILRFTSFPHRRFLLRKLIGQCRCVHVLSEYNRNLLSAKLPHLSVPVVTAPGAPSKMPAVSPIASRTDKAISILTVGRIHPRKGQLETLEALSRLPVAEQRQIRYRIVGPSVRPRYRKRILQLASRCPFPVEMVGPLNEKDLDEEYRSADIFAMTSRRDRLSVEGFGLVYIDASAYGLPIVATRSGGVPEAVLDQKTGLLADEGHIDEISENFLALIRSADLRKELGRRGREFASGLSWDQTAERVFGAPFPGNP